MVHPFICRLRHAGDLSGSDEDQLSAIVGRGEQIGAHQLLAQEGRRSDMLYILTEGMACRYKMMPDGKRAIVGLLLPGDISSTNMASDMTMDHSIVTLSICKLIKLPRHELRTMSALSRHIADALFWMALVEESTLREWLVSASRRPASIRMAHLFCEILTRLQAVELAKENKFNLPMTQADMADAMGLSSIHLNRTLQELRATKLVAFSNRHLVILDFEKLKSFAKFTPGYLRMRPARSS